MWLCGFRLWLLAFAAFFLMTAAWAFAAPYDASADEHDHIYRAAGIFAGDVAPAPADAVRGGGAFTDVPRGLVRESTACWRFKPDVPAACAPGPGSDRTTVRIGSGAGRYHPAYYALVGLPLKLWPGWSGVYLARLISGGLAAALLAGAVVVIVGHTRRRLMFGGLLVAVTPMAVHFFAAVNPNGLEIAAGVALVTALVPLVLGRAATVGGGPPVGLVTLAGLSAVTMASLRPTGLLYLAAAAVAFFLPVRREVLARLWRSRPARWWAGAVVASAVVAVLWAVVMESTYPGSSFRLAQTFSRGQAVMFVGQYTGIWLDQMVGVFGWLDNPMPTPVYVVWQLAVGGLLLFGVAFGGWTDRWRLAVIAAGGFVVPVAMQILLINETGFITQGRYLLPGLVGLPLLAAWFLEERGLAAAAGRTLTRLLLAVVLPVHLFGLLWAMMRWRDGVPGYGYLGVTSLFRFGSGWHPPVGSAVPPLLLVTGAAVLVWLVRRASAPSEAVSVAAPGAGAAVSDAAPGAGAAVPDAAAVPAERDGSMAHPDASGIEAVPGSNRGLV